MAAQSCQISIKLCTRAPYELLRTKLQKWRDEPMLRVGSLDLRGTHLFPSLQRNRKGCLRELLSHWT